LPTCASRLAEKRLAIDKYDGVVFFEARMQGAQRSHASRARRSTRRIDLSKQGIAAMKLRHAVMLALLLLCSCANANNAEVVAKATQKAEVAASRTEASADVAETAANRAAEAAKGAEQATYAGAEQLRRAEDMAQRLCTVCDVCSRGSGPVVRRFQEYSAIQYEACSAPWPPPVKTQTK
jgi:hypothetical protein